ncbi:transposase family protein [Streptomyces sp. NPDC018352]|uniref:transposase family protein n=1 Tax=Streptomyces sp. NPDC018352 TaxID=3157194 RepID=UPI0033D12F9A
MIVAHASPARGRRQRCGVCERRCARFGNGEGRRRWRALDLGAVRAFIEADAPRGVFRLSESSECDLVRNVSGRGGDGGRATVGGPTVLVIWSQTVKRRVISSR